MEFYTTSIAQRTRNRRTKFEQEARSKNKHLSSGLEKKKMKKNGGHRGKKLRVASSHKGETRKLIYDSPQCSDDDIVEIDPSEFQKVIQSKKSGDEATGSKIRESFSSLDLSSEPLINEKEEEDRVPVHKQNQYERCRIGQHGELYFIDKRGLFCKSCNNIVLDSKVYQDNVVRNSGGCGDDSKEMSFTSREVPRKSNKRRISYSKKHSDVVGSNEEARGYSRYNSHRSKKELVKTKKKGANDFEVGETSTTYHKEAYAGTSTRHGRDSIKEIEEIIAYSDDDMCDNNSSIKEIEEIVGYSDDDMCDSSSTEAIVVSSEEDCDEWLRENDVDSDTIEDSNEDLSESDDSDYLGYDSSSESLLEASTESDQVDEKKNNKEKISEKENDEDEDEAVSVSMKPSLKTRKRDESKKSQVSKKSKKNSQEEVRTNERESADKKALKSRKAPGRMNHQHTVSLPQSIKGRELAENTSFSDSDKEPINTVFMKKTSGPLSNARRDSSAQSEKANEVSKEEEEEEEIECLVRKPKRKNIIEQKDNNDGGTEQAGEPSERKCVYEKNNESECGEKTEQVVGPSAEEKNKEKVEQLGESFKNKCISGKKEDVLSTLLNRLYGRKERNDEEGLEENIEVNPTSPVEEPIPLKFRFDTDNESEEEKDEFELMVDGLFDELEYCKLQSSEISPPEPPKADSESEENAKDPYAGCRRGKHGELYFDEQIGLRCYICKEIILESKDFWPDLVNPPPRTSRKRDYRHEDLHFINEHASDLNGNGNYSQESCSLLEGTVWDIVPGVKEQMYPHQQEGIEFLWKNLAGTIDLSELNDSDLSGGGGCIISHAPGTGKTRLTIVFLEMFLKLFPDIRPVIIAPVSIILTWEEEFRKWQVKFPFHNLNSIEVPGREDLSLKKEILRVMKMSAWKESGGILGMSYSLFEKLAGEKFTKGGRARKKREKAIVDENLEMLRSILLEMPGLVVLDEGHIARNQTSSIWNALSNLKTEKCIILSGTPFQNNFEELFNTLSLVRPKIANKLSADKAFTSDSSRQIDEAIENLKKEIAPFVHVHKGSILQKSLPGLRDCIVVLNPDPLQKAMIDSMEKVQTIFEYDYKLALVSLHPSLLFHCKNLSEKEKSGFDQTELESMRLDYAKGVKTRFVMELVRLSGALGEKVLVFSQYVQPLDLVRDQLERVFGWRRGKEVLHIKGKLRQKNRQQMINVFNDPNSVARVMLASTKCCSEGIHLVGASRVVLLDVVWNPSVERQAICRAYRIGQKKIVHTYHLMTSGTNEGEKYARQVEKERISDLVFSASSPSSKSAEDERNEDLAGQLDDKILEDMIGETRFKNMFRNILKPKETNFFETFGS